MKLPLVGSGPDSAESVRLGPGIGHPTAPAMRGSGTERGDSRLRRTEPLPYSGSGARRSRRESSASPPSATARPADRLRCCARRMQASSRTNACPELSASAARDAPAPSPTVATRAPRPAGHSCRQTSIGTRHCRIQRVRRSSQPRERLQAAPTTRVDCLRDAASRQPVRSILPLPMPTADEASSQMPIVDCDEFEARIRHTRCRPVVSVIQRLTDAWERLLLIDPRGSQSFSCLVLFGLRESSSPTGGAADRFHANGARRPR